MSKIICNTRVMNAKLTGVQRYTQSILNHFPSDLYATLSPKAEVSRGVKGHLWDQLILPRKLEKQLLWSPNNTGPIFYKKQVVTIHDLVAIDHPEWLNKTFAKWYKFLTPILCKNAAHIIVISEFTKQRLQHHYNIPDEKITLIYNGVDPVIPQNSISNDALQLPFKRYILSLGSIEPRKNIPLLLKAWKEALSRLPDDVGLVIVGGKGNQQVFANTALGELPSRVHFTGHVSDEHITQLYQNALFFVYLSIYEGFGLPPLEAMAHGTAVLTGNKTSIPEVVGNAGIMIDPLSLEECKQAIIKLTHDTALCNQLAQKGYDRSLKFTWENAANQTLNVLKQVNSKQYQ